MKNRTDKKRVMVTELDNINGRELKVKIAEKDLLLDIDSFINESDIVMFTSESEGLRVSFHNGQAFTINVAKI